MSSQLEKKETEITKLKEENETLLKKFIPKKDVEGRKEMLSKVSIMQVVCTYCTKTKNGNHIG